MNSKLEYIKNSFTKIDNNINLEVDNINIECLTSKKNKFNLDSDGNLTVKSISVIEDTTNLISKGSIIDIVYPVGSIYLSMNSINPKDIFGGVWEKIAGRFLVGDGVSDNDDRGEVKNFVGGTKGGRYALTLSASIGETNNDITQIGYVGEEANNYQLGNRALYCVKGSQSAKFSKWNHATPVTDRNSAGSDVTNLSPYLVCYMWKRIS